MKKKTLFYLLTLVVAMSSIAQDSTKTKDLNEVVISATKSEKVAGTIPRSITILNRQQIEASSVKTLPELLAQQAGITVIGTGQNPGSNVTLSMRGTGNNHTVIMIDGVRVFDPSAPDNAIDLGELTLNNVERIEIIRGAHSTLYGSSAIGGVINIITKSGQEKPYDAVIDTRFNLNNELITNINLTFTDKSGLYGTIGANTILSEGFDAATDTASKPGFKERDKDGSSTADYLIKLGYQRNKLNIFSYFKNTNRLASIDKGAYTEDDNYLLEFNRKLVSLNAEYSISPNLFVNYVGAYSTSSRTSTDDSSAIDANNTFDKTYFKGNYTGQYLSNEVNFKGNFNKFSFTLGAGHTYENMNNESYYFSNLFGPPAFEVTYNLDTLNLNQRIAFAFAHAQLNGALLDKVLSNLNLNIGARFSNHSQFGNYTTFEVSPSYQLQNHLLFANISSAFNAPSLYQLYAPDQSFGSITMRGNNKLKPETALNREFGIRTTIPSFGTFSVSYFNGTINNTIQYAYLWDKTKAIDSLGFADYLGDAYLNTGKLMNNGYEVNLQMKINSRLSLSAAYTFLASKLIFNQAELDTNKTQGNWVQLYNSGKFINGANIATTSTRRPSNQLNLILFYQPLSGTTFRIDTRFIGARQDIFYNDVLGPFGALDSKAMQPYAVVDFYSRFSLSKNISIGTRIDNIFNKRYVEIEGYNVRGTTVWFDLRCTL